MIPQDYNLIREAAKERGWDNFKVMIIGDPGTGKTFSLKTLIKE
jgi:Cdc6-like AAA superfamily ATPase